MPQSKRGTENPAFEAMGHRVPAFRRSAANAHMKDMGFVRSGDSELRFRVVSRMAECIERDDSHEALEFGLENGVDATGCYRLLSVLLTAEMPTSEHHERTT